MNDTAGLLREIEGLREDISLTMLRDRHGISRRIDQLHAKVRQGERGVQGRLAVLKRKVDLSIRERDGRLSRRPSLRYPENLPITLMRREIVQSIRENRVVIISGETGSGKSTQIPKMCIEAGRGIDGLIGCTQPRRIAAITISKRIAEEMGEEVGGAVGYKIRFRDRTPADAFIKIMTDGILLAETGGDPLLMEYDTLIIDEAHERSLNIDFILGILRTLLPKRPELKLIITSATLDTEKFSEAFDHARIVEVGGRMYPVDLEYRPIDPDLEETGEVTYVDMAVKAVETLQKKRRFGDILIFMPTEQDILETCEKLEGRSYPGVAILPLFARLPADEQGRVYRVSGRKIVVATNVAETSLTIPGIKYVIDTGLARISQYLPGTRTNSLPIRPISRSSADQRKGRCGRVSGGVCIRLYSQDDYESRPQFTPPEIMRANLAEVILRMISLNLGDIASFPFIDRPNQKSIKDGFDLLLELGAIEGRGRSYTLTDKGRMMAGMPMDPKISRMILEAGKEGCVREVAIIASALSIQDPRERPLEKSAQADQVHAPFKNPDSDFMTLLNIWNRYHHTWERIKTQNGMRKFCRTNYLSFPRMREWIHIHGQIETILKEKKIGAEVRGKGGASDDLYAGIHRSILSGFLSNIANRKEKNIYTAARGREVMVFPGSAIFNKGHPWIVAAEMVKTSRLFARTAAGIDVGWLEPLGGSLCRSSYSAPHWEKKRGEVRALEQVRLYGLVIVPGRSVSFGAVDPQTAHDIFIRSALVEGDVQDPPPFLRHNLQLIEKLKGMEDKVRRRGILIAEDMMADFYSERLQGVCDIRTLKKVIRERGGDDFIRMQEEDLILSLPDENELGLYPDQLSFDENRFRMTYKFAPGRAQDGATITVPSSLVDRIPAERLDWGVPGLLKEKITALIKGLPKRYRKQLVPVSGTVDIIMAEMAPTDQPLVTALARFIYERFRVDIPASAFADVALPDYLTMRLSIIDHQGRETASGRDIRLLKGDVAPVADKIESTSWAAARKERERTGIREWDFGTLPESIPCGQHLFAYPGLEPSDEGVNIRLYPSFEEALDVHQRGVECLFTLWFSKDLKFLKRDLKLPRDIEASAIYFGGVQAVENMLYRSLLKQLFRRNIRTREDFDAHAERVWPRLFSRGKELREKTVKILDAYHQARSSLHAIEKTHKSNRSVRELCSEIRKDMDALVPYDFLNRHGPDRLEHIPRYLKAMQVRVERGANDPEKDRRKMQTAEVFIRALNDMRDGLSSHASRDKMEALDDLRWMIEEFKVSLFAQELKTPYPVSEKRLKENIGEIGRMV